jgi:hypothetical protein
MVRVLDHNGGDNGELFKALENFVHPPR